MNSQSPLLKFKERTFNPQNSDPEETKYDLELGYWKCEDGMPLINKLVESNNETIVGQTTKTATRESIDQVESIFAQTGNTKTRESIDQSESVVSVFAQTTITRSREGADQSESSVSIYAQTTITETREGADRSERVA